MIAQLLLGLAVAYLSWSLLMLEVNYRRASSIGIPLVRLPFDPGNLAWVILGPSIWGLLDRLPFSWGAFSSYYRREWQYLNKAESFLRHGPIWALVTSQSFYVYLADPDTIHDVCIRRADFLRPSHMYKPLELYGPIISSASWSDWPRHRKALAAPFNENIMRFVWTETLDQARQMLQLWVGMAESGISSVAEDMRTLSLNVLAATGFRRSYKFRGFSQPGTDETRSNRDALQTVLDNAILLMIFPPRMFSLPWLPRSWARIGKAAADFKQYLVQVLDEEIYLLDQGKGNTGGLMSSLVQALNTRKKQEAAVTSSNMDQTPSKGLSVEEIFGNMFLINFAGHDTTANTLAFSMILLAANPEIQDWVAEELQEVIKNPESETWDYNVLFPQLRRCRAVLLETLRLYPPILTIPKWTNQHPQPLRIGERTYVIPPHTVVMSSMIAVQTHPKYWENRLVWRPTRWVTSSSSQAPGSSADDEPDSVTTQLRQEVLFTPAQGTYLPWSDGPQNCLGAKFAQVEFVAVLACLLRDHRVRVVAEPNESIENARKRALATVDDCKVNLLLQMRNPDKVRLVWKRV